MLEPTTKQLRKVLDQHLANTGLSDHALLAEFEIVAKARCFGALTQQWAPALYRRNRVVFRPFVIAHFSNLDVSHDWRWKAVKWPNALDAWMAEVDAADDIELFRRLWTWRHENAVVQWKKDLVTRYTAARDVAARRTVLEKMEMYFPIDEPTAIALYRADPTVGDFILAHAFQPWGVLRKKREVWSELATMATARGDEKLRWALYRRQVDDKKWGDDVRAIAKDKSVGDEQLTAALTLRHPESVAAFAPVLLDLIELRGKAALPYVMLNVARLRSYGGADRGPFEKIVKRALKEDWLELWGALLRTVATQDEYLRAVKAQLQDRERPENELLERLTVLAGVGQEWNAPGFGIASIRPLDDATALLFHERFPQVLARQFRAHLVAGWWLAYPKLVSRLVDAGNEDLLDYLASRLVTRIVGGAPSEVKETVELLAAYYEGHKRTPLELAQKAARVLGQIPAFALRGYDAVIRDNRLARLLFERSVSVYLEDPIVIRDLLEAPEIHVQILGLRALGLDDPRARALAAENVDLLEPTLLRALHRKSRIEAFRALANAAQTQQIAQRIVQKAKDAMALPDRRYPKEALVGLIGALLSRWPQARGAGETAVVYR